MNNQTFKPRFTQRHYNELYAFTKRILQTLVDDNDPDSLQDGVAYYHNMLAKLFIEDNGKFKPELWKLERI